MMISISHCVSLATSSLQAYYHRRLFSLSAAEGSMSPADECGKSQERQPETAVAPPIAEAATEVKVREISQADTRTLRREVLRPDLDVVSYEGDHDATSIHLGAFVADELVGVISLFQEDLGDVKSNEAAAVKHLPTPTGRTQWRIRGFAVAATMRSRGLGTKLIEACINVARQRQGQMVWCVARCSAEVVYKRQGFNSTGDVFQIEGVGPVVHMFKYI